MMNEEFSCATPIMPQGNSSLFIFSSSFSIKVLLDFFNHHTQTENHHMIVR